MTPTSFSRRVCRRIPVTPAARSGRPLSSVRLPAVVAAALLLGLAGGIPRAKAAELPLVRVVLSSAGLAQFVHAGTVEGGTNVELSVRLDQVDDVLKSLTVLDREGAVGPVGLPGKTPLAELFRDLPFGPDALKSPTALLDALVGAEIEIAGPVAAKGRMFRVVPETVTLPDGGGTTTRHRVSLMTEQGLVQAVLEDVTTLRFTDPETRAQIARALGGVAENRAKERRTLSVGFLGKGSRPVALGYVVAAPVWKTSYRLVLPKDGGTARLQGWAVVENLTGGDWKNIELTLVSGNPVALKQPLYTPVMAERTEVPVATGTKIVPRSDDAAAGDVRRKAASGRLPNRRADTMRAMPQSLEAAPYAPALAAPPQMPDVLAAAGGAAAEEAATQLLYRFPEKISLATGHTMMVPFVDRAVKATRTWIFQPDVASRHPLAAVRVVNDGDSGLPAGIVTAYEGGTAGALDFVGDARLPLVPRGAEKFVTFALDTRTDIRREDLGVKRTSLGKIVDGVLTVTARSRRTMVYEITPPAGEDRAIVIEEPRIDGWKPVETAGIEETPTRVRLTVDAPKGETTKASLVLERTDLEIVRLTDLAPEQIFAQMRGLDNESPALKAAVQKLGTLVGEITRTEAKRNELAAERRKIADDQARLRQNLAAVGAGTDLGRRYLDTLKAQEDRLATIDRTDDALEAEAAKTRQAARDLVQQLTL